MAATVSAYCASCGEDVEADERTGAWRKHGKADA